MKSSPSPPESATLTFVASPAISAPAVGVTLALELGELLAASLVSGSVPPALQPYAPARFFG